MTSTSPALGVALIGYGFMGAAHSHAWRNVHRIFPLPHRPEMRVICGRNPDAVRAAADRWGWATSASDWNQVVTRDDVDIVDICTPGDTHPVIAIAALDAGKHVLCEKPLANTVAEAEAMGRAAERAADRGVRSMVGFNYRRVPATTLARDLVQDGQLGSIRHIRGLYLQDWLLDPSTPIVWRLQAERAGSGALGDIGAHAVDLAQFVTGHRLSHLCADLRTFIAERPMAEETASAASPASHARLDRAGAGDGPTVPQSETWARRTAPVTVDDAAAFLARTDQGAIAMFEASRFATGYKNALRLEVNGSAGSLVFDLENLNELRFYDATQDPKEAGFRRILVTEPGHPYMHAWWPPGHIIGYEHTFVHEVADFITAIGEGRDPSPSFADGLAVQRILAAVLQSAATQQWISVTA